MKTRIIAIAMTLMMLFGTSSVFAATDISKAKFSNYDFGDTAYTGLPQQPAFDVTLNGKALSEDIDFTTSYKNNLNAGKGTIIITGIGNYSGTASVQFNIWPNKINAVLDYGWPSKITNLQKLNLNPYGKHVEQEMDWNTYEKVEKTMYLKKGRDFTITSCELRRDNDTYDGKVRTYLRVNGKCKGNYKGTIGRNEIPVKCKVLKLEKTKATIKKGKTYQIKVKKFDPLIKKVNSGFKQITYKSSNPKVATVSKKGKIKAKKPGTATITVKNKYETVKFKVKVKKK